MSRIDRRGVLRLFSAAGAAGFVAACGSTQSSGDSGAQQHDEPVRIGLLVPSTGGFKPLGDDIRNGFQKYVAGTDGRLGGHPVTELEEDEGDTPDEARAALEALLEQDVHAVVGATDPAGLLETGPLLEEAHVPLVSAHASPQDLQGSPYVWRTSYVHRDPGLALGEYLARETSGSVAIVAADDPMGTDMVDGLREGLAAEGGSDRLREPVFTPDDRDPGGGFFDEALAQLAIPPEPAVTVAAYAGRAAVAFVQQYVDAGYDTGQLFGPGSLTDGPALAEQGSDALGIRTAANYSAALRLSANRGFAVSYRSEFGSPSMYAVASRDAAAVLDTAIRATDGAPTSRRINLALGEVGLVDSPRGRWQFNQNRTPTQKWFLREVAPDGPVLNNMVIRELGTFG